MTNSISVSEIESLRFHLGYGNVSVGAYPYTPDGFLELFSQVVAPNITTGAETTATTAVTAAATAAITPAAMTGIVLRGRLVIDVADAEEVVVVQAVTLTTFTAAFKIAHPATGYPIAVESGMTRLRTLLHSADRVWASLQAATVTSVAGLKSVDDRGVEWYEGGSVLRGIEAHYTHVCRQLSRLTRVPIAGDDDCNVTRVEAY